MQNVWRRWGVWIIVVGVIVAANFPFRDRIAAALESLAPHAPDWALFAALPTVVKVHIAAALTALAIGIVIMARPKGRGLHKALGWSWVIAMAATALSSLLIRGLGGDFFSIIHLLSGWVIIALPMAIFAIRRGNIQQHRRSMTGLFVGGLIIAGAFTFLPGRFMFNFLLG